jgi:hypothetical protein
MSASFSQWRRLQPPSRGFSYPWARAAEKDAETRVRSIYDCKQDNLPTHTKEVVEFRGKIRDTINAAADCIVIP